MYLHSYLTLEALQMEVLAEGPELLHPGLPLLGHDGLVAATTHGAELPDNISTSEQGNRHHLYLIQCHYQMNGGWINGESNPFDLRSHLRFYDVVVADS